MELATLRLANYKHGAPTELSAVGQVSPIHCVLMLASTTFAAVCKDAAFTEFFRRTNGIVATDGAFSVPLTDGRVLWLFGDSYVDCYRDGTIPCLFQVRNAAMLHHKDDLQNVQPLIGKHSGIKSLFKNSSSEDPWFWPVAGFQHSNTVYVYLTSLKKSGSGNLGFARTGQDYWAKMKFPQLEASRSTSARACIATPACPRPG